MSILQSKIIKGAVAEPQKVVIYGPQGIGKSTLAAGFPKPLFLDTEKGTRRLPVDRVAIESLDEFNAVLKDPALTDYQTIVVDTIDWLESKCADALCAEFKETSIESNDKGSAFSYGKGVVKLGERMMQILLHLDKQVARGLNVVLLGHSMVRKIDLPDSTGAYDRYELDLNQKHVAPLVKHWCDALLFFNYQMAFKVTDAGFGREENKAVRVRNRILYCNHSAAADAKNRHGLGDEEPATIETIQRAFAAVGAPWDRVNANTAKVAAVAEQVKKAAKPANGQKPGKEKISAPANGVQGEPATTGEETQHETKPESKPAPDYDGVPGLPPENGGAVEHPLTAIIGEHEEAVNSFLRARREITPLQTYKDLEKRYIDKVLKNPAGFMAVANPMKIGGAA